MNGAADAGACIDGLDRAIEGREAPANRMTSDDFRVDGRFFVATPLVPLFVVAPSIWTREIVGSSTVAAAATAFVAATAPAASDVGATDARPPQDLGLEYMTVDALFATRAEESALSLAPSSALRITIISRRALGERAAMQRAL